MIANDWISAILRVPLQPASGSQRHADALTLAEALRHTIEAMDLCDRQPCTASFGVAAFERGDTVESLINRSDKALYRAKRAGRNLAEKG